ncbi:hypothetical protein CASFOL_007598 [Castilleja foliolosa]|uniref:Uncharacterized protein n=1 Tax=Castilleja foliolosa TaxID=1961234 RepID=A0ABD3E520_9LAMI
MKSVSTLIIPCSSEIFRSLPSISLVNPVPFGWFVTSPPIHWLELPPIHLDR